MKKRIAFECYADGDFLHFLRTVGQIELRPFHAYGQGEVVNAVLVRGACEVGLVDEDPAATHHRERDKTRLVRSTPSIELRSRGDRHLLVVKPDLERCFLRSMGLAGLKSSFPPDFSAMHAALNVERSVKHETFRDELGSLYEASRRKGLSALVTDALDLLRSLT